jgi:hypothetical protein
VRSLACLLAYASLLSPVCAQLLSGTVNGRCANVSFDNAFTNAEGVIQNVTYVVPDEQANDVCRGPWTRKITWYNKTDEATGQPWYYPGGIDLS